MGAVPKRIREFALGRYCLRRALSDLQISPQAILTGTFREPILPFGITASITHCDTVCAAAALLKSTGINSLGIDCEENTPLDSNLIAHICTEQEIAFYRKHIQPNQQTPDILRQEGLWAKTVFSIKESYYKAYYQITGSFLDFLEAEVVLDTKNQSASVKPKIQSKVNAAHLPNLFGTGYYKMTDSAIFSAISICP